MSGSCSETPDRADPALVGRWLAARSIARGLPPPVAIPGGWRVETAGEIELRRYVFPDTCAELHRLAPDIAEPGIYLKLCSDIEVLTAMLPTG